MVRGLSEAEVELAKLRLEGASLEATFSAPEALAVRGRFLELADARSGAARAWAAARDHFFGARFADARQVGEAARAAAAGHEGDPQVARTLARLDLLAAQCGDADGYRRAAAHSASLELDEAQWSPEVRAGFARAVAARAASTRTRLRVSTEPPGATVFADGELLGVTPLSADQPVGEHAVLLFRDGFLPVERAVLLEVNVEKGLDTALEPQRPSELFGGLRLRLDLGGEPSEDELVAAARQLSADVFTVLDATAPGKVRALAAGPGVARTAFERSGARLTALREVMDELRGYVATACAVAHQPPGSAKGGQPLPLTVTAGPCVETVKGAYRQAGKPGWSALELPRAEGPSALSLPALPSSDRPYTLEYHLWGETPARSRVDGAGSEKTPLRVPVEADRSPPSTPFYRTAWFWGVVGGAAAVSVVTVAVWPGPGSVVRL
ncbi:MAG: PEGA domain-containing protein [Myxococcaceae bacterium]